MTVEALVWNGRGPRRLADAAGLTQAANGVVYYMGAVRHMDEAGMAGVLLSATDPFVMDDTVPQRVRRYSRTDEASAPPPSPPPPGVTWSPTDKSTEIALTAGNLTATASGAAGYHSVRGSISRSSGKRYYEWTQLAPTWYAGIGTANSELDGTVPGFAVESTAYQTSGYIANGAWDFGPYAASINGSVIGCAVDFTAGKVWFSVNGAWQKGDPVAGTGGDALRVAGNPAFPMFGCEFGSTASCTANFGGSAFAYAIPSGFVAWAVA